MLFKRDETIQDSIATTDVERRWCIWFLESAICHECTKNERKGLLYRHTCSQESSNSAHNKKVNSYKCKIPKRSTKDFISTFDRNTQIYLLGPPILPKPKLLLAVVAILWIPVRFSQAELRPSMMATTSSATRRANMSRPLPRDLRFDAASRIHSKAVRRRWRRPSGTGIWRATPPPAAPRWERMRMRGAMLSTARVR